MKRIKESDLLLNEDGSIYHLKIKPEELADTVLVVGDPARAEAVAGFFDTVEHSTHNREFYSHTGRYKGLRITALSTGIGTDNIDIVLNELDALANIDFNTRSIKNEHRTLRIIRLGTSGSMHPDVPSGSMVLSSFGLGIDGTMQYYDGLERITDLELTSHFIQSVQWPDHLPRPYIIPASQDLVALFDNGPVKGITVTAPGFYASQGREVRLKTSFPDMLQKVSSFEHKGHKVVNFVMETAALYGLSTLLGHRAVTLCVILANRAQGTYDPKYKESVQEMTRFVLEALVS